MKAAMDAAGCSLCIFSREKVTAILLFLLTTFGRLACGAGSGLLCYSCTNVPHPRDCNRIVRCGPTEACSVETFITPSGNTVYDMGCSSQLKCQNSLSVVGRRESSLPSVKKRDDLKICIECCTNGSFCNRELCDTKVNLTGKICMQCDDVVHPMDCATVALCQPGEICYTESKIIHGENRYRLGCVKETSCQLPDTPETITTISPLLDFCGICCKRDIENCNLELCDHRGGTLPNEIVQMYLIDPPIDFSEVYCHDVSEIGCILAGAEKAGYCNNPTIKNHACPKFCGTCVPNPTLAPGISTTYGTDTTNSRAGISTSNTTLARSTITSTSATTIGISSNPSRRDCFFRSSVYLGHISTTIDNITCDRWDAHLVPNDSLVSMLPDQRLDDAHNYCRDPDGKGHPWCYVKGNPVKTWEFCGVPYCQECYYANQSHLYNGYVSSTNSGACFNWTGFPDNSFIDGNKAKAKNYCRDPDHTGYPYCFTSSGLTQCTIPQCKGMCEDDPTTRCEDLKTILCQSDHFAKLLCPKSCDMCGFGLLEPVHIHPTVTKDCADDPMARCDELKELICADHAKATQYCPRTCNLCGSNNTIGVTGMKSTTRTISTRPPIITQAYSTIGVTSMMSTTTAISTTLQTTPQGICVDVVNYSCNNPEIKALICIDVPAATNFCRKTCDLCNTTVVKIDKDQCGDPIKEPMCKLLHEEMCICYDQIISSVLCPRYCGDHCGPVNRIVTCPGPTADVIIGRR